MPSYNHKKFIEYAINSVVSQTLKDRELIIVDDHSRDGSAATIESWTSAGSTNRSRFPCKERGDFQNHEPGYSDGDRQIPVIDGV